jgi:hypothetical protein
LHLRKGTISRKILETEEMNALRETFGKTRLDDVWNHGIREQCRIQPIGEWANEIGRKGITTSQE